MMYGKIRARFAVGPRFKEGIREGGAEWVVLVKTGGHRVGVVLIVPKIDLVEAFS